MPEPLANQTDEQLAAEAAREGSDGPAFVELLRAQCSQPGHGMANHPIVLGLEADTVTLPQLRHFTEQFYLHIRNMDQPSLARFERELYSDVLGTEGLVLDMRGNGGGNTHDKILNVLSRRVYGFTQPRDGQRMSQPEKAFTKPVVLLINQNSYSDAEIFPAGFRALGIGKIVGVPTPGYVIGTYGGQLVDGTSFRLPSCCAGAC